MWVLLFLGTVPAITVALRVFPNLRPVLLGLMAFSTCHITKPFYMEVFFEDYRGVDRGFGITLTDILFFSFAAFLVFNGDKRNRIWWPFNLSSFVLLTLISTMSVATSEVPYYGLFALHKLIRGALLYWVVINLLRTREDIEIVVKALLVAVIFQTWTVIKNKYITGEVINRVEGSFPHPNTLAMYMDMIIPMSLGWLLVGGKTKWINRLTTLALLGGILCVIFTKSRAALVIMSAGLLVMPPILFAVRPTRRILVVSTTGGLLLMFIGALAAPNTIKRFEEAPEESKMTRVYFNNAAKAMANENFWGTGLNSYSWMLKHTDYYWYMYPEMEFIENPDEFRHGDTGSGRLGTAHNIYYLFAAETGWIGLAAFLVLISRFYWHNIVLFFRERDPQMKALLLGLALGFTTLHLQGTLEWIFRQTQVFYLFIILSGVMVAVGRLQPRNRYII